MKSCGKSKFFELRPKHVIEVGAAGIHNVCVCEKHQNIKLMLDAVSDTTEKYLCMDMIFCDVKSYVCMMKRCESCPGTEPLIFLKSQIGDLSIITFKQWESTDRTILVNTELPTTEFLTLLVNKIDF
jgi:hypothetical protein